MIGQANYSGLVIAGIGFFLTRFTVTLALSGDPLQFYLAGFVPLALGLGLAAFGVALTVADVDPALVRTAARWCVAGFAAMLVLVALTLLGASGAAGAADGWLALLRSRASLANVLIGGSVGGTLTGLYSARARRQREQLRGQTRRLEVLNRLLRHEVLNAVAVIRGYATLDADGDGERGAVIARHADAIERTIDEVRYLTRRENTRGGVTESLPLAPALSASVEAVRERHPEADLSVDSVPGSLSVRANDRLEQVFTHLLENAAVHTPADAPEVRVRVESTPTAVRVHVSDDGPGLPEPQQALLETGDIAEFDEPGSGFGLNVVRLLVESYDGAIELDVDETGSTVTVVLRRGDLPGTGLRAITADAGVRPAIPHLLVILVAGLVAGVVYGASALTQGGSIAAIGVFYGIENRVVGWYTHEFHSVVFAFGFAGLVSLVPARHRNSLPVYVAVGAAWGVVLWVVAAGLVAPAWLRLLGIPAPIPNLQPDLLVNHLLWGGALGALTAWGYRRLDPTDP